MSRLYRIAVFLLFSLSIQGVSTAQCGITVDAGDDIYLCSPPTPTQLNGSISGDFLSFAWTPTTGLSGFNSLTPSVNVTQSATYVLSVSAADLSNNLVTNGDFEGGNSDFTSDYIYNPGDLVPEGVYDVIDNPQADHPGFAACDDHTTGAGNMMVVNGAGSPNQNVWCQTVPVTPNAQYVLSAWVTSVVAASPALLQFSINGNTVGPIFNAPGSVCNWQNYFQVWNSGSNTSATICVVNQNTTLGGNDFALDDIVFAPVCIQRDTVKVIVVNVTAVAAPQVVTLPCDGANTTLSGVGSSTGTNISYLWETPTGNIVSGETTLNPVINAAGTYTLTVSYTAPDGTVCEKTASVNVVLNPNPLAAWINPPAPLGCGSATTTLVGNSNQSAFSSFAWETLDGHIVSGDNQKNCVVNQIGTYTLTVTNNNTGCTATAEVTVIATTTPPLANATVSDTLTCFQDTVTLASTGSSTGANISYAWTTANGHLIFGQNTATALADTTGIYILSVTNNSNNCTSRDTVTVIGNLVKPYMFLPPQQQITCSSDTIAMIVYLYPPPFVIINWTTTDGHIVSGQYTPNPHVDSMGTYHVTIQDPINGCISTGSAFVTSNMNYPTASITPPGGITCQSPSITLSGTGSSTGAQFGYSWTASGGGNLVSGETTLTPVVNSAGNYVLTVLDSLNGCISMANTSVVADTNVVTVIANAPDTLSCAVLNMQLNANGSSSGASITYAWTTTDGNIVSGSDTPNPLIDKAGTYQLLLSNTANGCAGIDLAVVIENVAPPQISINPPAELTCANPTQVLNALNNGPAGNYSYNWTASNGGNITLNPNTLSPTVDAAGTYTLTTTNLVNGCTSSVSTTVSLAMGVPAAIASVPGPLTCTQTTQTVDGAGSSVGATYTYNWTAMNGGSIIGSNTNITATAGTIGDYILAVTNSANGCVSFDTIAVSQNIAPPPADAGAPDTLTCTAPTAPLTANASNPSATLTYAWTTIGGSINGGANTAQVDAAGAGWYFVAVTDPANGCKTVDSVQVFEDKLAPALNLTTPATLTCVLQSQTLQVQNLSPTGNFTYAWTATNGGNIVSGNTSLTPVVDTQGTYFLTATNLDNGCSTTLTAMIAEDIAAPNLQIAVPGQITCTNPNQTLQGQNLSAPGNFSYSWTAANGGTLVSGMTTLTPIVSTGGDYTVVSTNTDNGCSSTATVNVVQNNTPPTADAGVDATLTCNLNSLTINGAGSGAPNLQYNWTASNGGHIASGGTTATPVIDAPGTYSLNVVNPANGCSATDLVEIFNDANAPTANAGTSPPLTCVLTQTTLNGTGSTGANFSYQWTASGGGNILQNPTTLTPTVNEPGVYTLVVTNAANGCTRTSSVTLTENITPPVVDAGQNTLLTCAVTSLSLTATSTGGAATYAWQTTGGNILSGGTSLSPTINQTGTYTFTATLGANGCSASDNVTVTIDTISPVFNIQPPGLLTCAQTAIPLTGTVQQPAAGNFSASWSTNGGHFVSGQNTLTATIDVPATYILTIVNNQNGCDAALAIPVFQNTVAPVATAAPGGTLTCAVQNLTLSGNGSSAGGNFSYSWTGGQILTGPTTLAPTVGSAGTYTLLVTNNSTGCTATTTTTVSSNTTPPTAAIAQPGLLTCTQNTVTLNGTGSSTGANFNPSWSTNGGNILSGQTTLNPVVNQPGNYTLTVSNSQNGCSSTSQIVVIQNIATPGADAGAPDELHCNHLQATLSGSSPAAGTMAYAWSSTNGHIVSGANAQSPIVDAPGVYNLVVTNPLNGCTSADNVAVTAIPLPDFEPTLEQPDCHDRNGVVDFGSVTGGQSPFQFSTDGGQTFGSQTLVGNLAPDAYSLVVRDAFGCTAETTVTVNEPFIPTLSIPAVATLEVGDSVLLQPVTDITPGLVASWTWTPADDLSCSDCQNPWAKPFKSTEYSLVVSDQNGCEAEARVRILVNRKRNIYAPNVFTPNDDGVNDFFMIFGKGVKEIHALRVFDRWGSELFLGEHLTAGDETAGWNGSYRGDPMTPAVFVWWAKVEFIDGTTEIFYGDVTLMR